MKVFEVLQENFISNLIGDVRNAFKPGIAVTPNMIAELEDGLARLERGEQPTPRQQKMMDTFLNTTMSREIKKTFGVDIEEGFGDWFKKADSPQDMQQDVVPLVKQLLDQGMSEQEVVAQVEQELGVRPRYIQQAIRMVRAGLAEGRLKSKSYRKSYKAAKASGRRRRKRLRDDTGNNDQKLTIVMDNGEEFDITNFEGNTTREKWNNFGKAIENVYSKHDTPIPSYVLKRGDKIIATSRSVGNIYNETATSGGTSAGAIATVANPSVTRNAKKPKKRKGIAPNALDSGANLMTGQVLKR